MRASADSAAPAAPSQQAGDAAVAAWLFICAAMVVAMMLIGATTRLTESGLSIAEWRPLMGWIPPMGETEWERVFALYRDTSEYRLQNAGMSLAEFRTIFWWEYIHRVWGRLIGIVFLLPFVYFLIRRRIGRPLVLPLIGLFALGGLQGLIGWWMVKSGFVNRTDVSQYRLAAHLGMAFLILGLQLWIAIGMVQRRTEPVAAGLRRTAGAVLAVVFVTVLAGALVAGTDAGLVYNTWPLMDAGFVPENLADLSPWWLNLFENHGTVQFQHRMLAYATAAAVGLFWWRAQKADLSPEAQTPVNLMAATVLLQLLLGILTVINQVPLALGVLHQGGAILLFCTAVWTCRRFKD